MGCKRGTTRNFLHLFALSGPGRPAILAPDLREVLLGSGGFCRDSTRSGESFPSSDHMLVTWGNCWRKRVAMTLTGFFFVYSPVIPVDSQA